MKEKKSDIFNFLISDRGFINWVRNPTEESDYFWNTWLEEQPQYSTDFNKACEFVKKLKFNDESLKESEMNTLLGEIIKGERSKASKEYPSIKLLYSTINSGFKYAAIIVILLSLAIVNHYWSPNGNKDISNSIEDWEIVSNPRGVKSKITLPDGSIVDLNYESSLKFPKEFSGKTRTVELVGEAYFDVQHMDDFPFIVKSGVLETEVFGTSFNVNSFIENDSLNISLVTGKVKVLKREGIGKEKDSVFLEPGEELSYHRNTSMMIKSEFDIEKTLAWKNGIIIFEDVGFDEFIDRLEVWYGVNFQIHGNPPKNWKFNGRYQNEEIENILSGVKFVYGLEYKIQNKNVIMKFK